MTRKVDRQTSCWYISFTPGSLHRTSHKWLRIRIHGIIPLLMTPMQFIHPLTTIENERKYLVFFTIIDSVISQL